MGRLYRSTDWSATPLGPLVGWPESLRIAVSICMNSRFPMFVWWGDALINLYNDAYVPVLGARHPRAFAQPARSIWHEIWDTLGPQVQEVMNGRATWNDRQLLMMERNGFVEETWFTWSYSPIYSGSGDIGGLFCACTEETPRVLAERERDALTRRAQDTATQLHNWFDNAPGFIALLRGPDMVFELVNKAYYQLVGHRPILGRPVFEALPEVRGQGFEQILKTVWDTGERFVGRGVPVQLQRAPGTPPVQAFIDVVYQPVFDSAGQVTGVFSQGHDVTEQVQALQRLHEADRRKNEFLATLAHELRNPMAPIRQAVALARSGDVDEAKRRWALDVIDRQARHMSLLLDDLLDVTRVSQGRLQLRREPVVLQQVLESALETARPALEAKRHRLEIDWPEAPIRLPADGLRLAQVVSNLLSNAAKYTDEGGRIQLQAGVDEAQAWVRVSDNGIGLSPESLGSIFEMFSQVTAALHRSQGGLGIGLALSKGLVEMHGGTLGVSSAGLGQGSTFELRLPLRPEGTATQPTQ